MAVTRQASTSPSSRSRKSRILAIASGKGGVGKTWLAVTLSLALARLERRVLLFDGDLGLANVDIQLGLMPDRDLHGVLAGTLSLPAAISTYGSASSGGAFDLIAGRSGSATLAALPVERLSALADRLGSLGRSYDDIILDLGAGVENTVRQLSRAASTSLVITTDEPTSLTDAYAYIKLTQREFPRTQFRIVVNMARSTKSGEHTYRTIAKACESFLAISPPLAAIIRRDDHVADAIRHQTPLLVRHPNSPASVDVTRLAECLARSP